MKIRAASPLLLAALLAASLPARADGGEVGLLFDRLGGKAQTVAAGQQVAAGNYDAVSPTGLGFRAGLNLLDRKVLSLGLNATYHPRAEQDLKLGGTTLGKYGNEYAALGAGLDWKFLLNLHAGVEIRRERLSADLRPASGTGVLSGSVSSTRPWMTFGVGFSVPLPLISPFVRLEVATPTTRNDRTGTPDDLREALAPQLQVAVYAGIRF